MAESTYSGGFGNAVGVPSSLGNNVVCYAGPFVSVVASKSLNNTTTIS